MKIAFFLNEFPATSETFILNQMVGLIRRGHKIDIYAQCRSELPPSGLHADVEQYRLLDFAHFYPLPGSKLARLGSVAERLVRWGWRRPLTTLDSLNVFRHGRSSLNLTLPHELLPPPLVPPRYDVTHCHFGPNGRLAVAWRAFGVIRGPIITTFHGYDVHELPRIEGRNLYGDLFSKGELFTVGSEFMKERLLALGAPEARVVKLPMGVDLSRFTLAQRSEDRNGKIRLLTVARLVEGKGIEYAIHAIELLKNRYPHLRYQIVGDGPLRGRLIELTSTLGLRNHVEFLGALPQESVIQIYRNAHIFLLPSVLAESGWEESQAVVLAEAQAVGLPVIATRTGGISESICDGKSGNLVPPRDPIALADAIERLAKHPDRWSGMGRAGRAYVKDRFDIEKLIDRLVDLYRTVAHHAHN
jgi:colanic acid/amylovoran biosynthesis glycosyltransferase